MMEQINVLIAWTPFLMGGFMWNIIISLLAAAIGTAIGYIIATMRASGNVGVSSVGTFMPTMFRSAPTLVLMFYLATLLPDEIPLFDNSLIIYLPNWFKATLAMTASQIGFNSLSIYSSMMHWRAGDKQSALMIIPNWLGGFLITLLSSSGASLVGVSELVSRVNTVIKAEGADNIIALYLYAITFFLLSGWAFTALIKVATSRLIAKAPVESVEM
jgi:polar amino acid transport system permease protein